MISIDSLIILLFHSPHSKQCGNHYSSKLYRVSHSDAQKPSGWPQDWLYSDVPVGKTSYLCSSVDFILFLLSGWCQTRPFCADFKIPCEGITLIWLKRLTAIYFSPVEITVIILQLEKKKKRGRGCSEIMEVWTDCLGSPGRTISTMDRAYDIYTVKKKEKSCRPCCDFMLTLLIVLSLAL